MEVSGSPLYFLLLVICRAKRAAAGYGWICGATPFAGVIIRGAKKAEPGICRYRVMNGESDYKKDRVRHE